MSAGLSSPLLYIGDKLLRCPFVSGIEAHHFSVRSDQRRRERVSDHSVSIVGHPQVEKPGHLGEHRLPGHGEIPVSKSTLRIAADIACSIGAQPLRRIIFRIEADANQMGSLSESRAARQLLVDCSKVTRDPWAEIGHRTTRINESNQQRLALELAEMD